MIDFREVLESQRASEAFIAETGGMPEIARAAEDLRTAIGQTRTDIAQATFASRFPNPPSDFFRTMKENVRLSPNANGLVEKEGEAGYKRAELEGGISIIEFELLGLINRLVHLRCDLIVSQIEM